MIGKLILTHGGMARELLAAAQVISGRLSNFEALSLDWNDGLEESKAQISAAITRLDQGQGVLILTDMYGGTPCNMATSFFAPGKVEILTGVNLPMVLRLACQSTEDGNLAEVARWLQAKAQRSLCLVSDMVQPPKCEEEAVAAEKKKRD
ncbi:MAG TPA: PTS fructose transporter subunit IIA [Thermoanaerobaculia bacterium]|nr:PTS fructose transporter subunit IIA [Thermoanaerobaculia bacterium]